MQVIILPVEGNIGFIRRHRWKGSNLYIERYDKDPNIKKVNNCYLDSQKSITNSTSTWLGFFVKFVDSNIII